jgi:hypothetical protein
MFGFWGWFSIIYIIDKKIIAFEILLQFHQCALWRFIGILITSRRGRIATG